MKAPRGPGSAEVMAEDHVLLRRSKVPITEGSVLSEALWTRGTPRVTSCNPSAEPSQRSATIPEPEMHEVWERRRHGDPRRLPRLSIVGQAHLDNFGVDVPSPAYWQSPSTRPPRTNTEIMLPGDP